MGKEFEFTTFDLAIAMEVFEHLTEQTIEEYLNFLKSILKGYLIVTVPVEIGPVFLLKYIIKRFHYKDDQEMKSYTLKELLYATILKSCKVKRNWGGHKGFDYRKIIKEISEYFSIVEVFGMPFNFKPTFLNLTIGILAKSS